MLGRKCFILIYASILTKFFSPCTCWAFFDFHFCDAYEHYEIEKRDWERQNPGEFWYMSYPEWIEMDDQRSSNVWSNITGCFSSPEPENEAFGQHLNERGND
jgi:hypothetical protein